MTENEKYLYDHFLISIKSGFESLEDVIDGALEAVEDEGWQKEISEEWVREVLTRECEKNLAASKSWSKETDCDKLSAVFDSLCKKKILALHSVGYTTSEAIYDTQLVWQELEDEGIHPIGYCYYHGQDLERVVETGELQIGFYGKEANNEKDAIVIGNIVAAALEDAGFTIKWNKTSKERIKIVDFNWQNVFSSDDEVDNKWGPDRVFQLMKG